MHLAWKIYVSLQDQLQKEKLGIAEKAFKNVKVKTY